MSRKSSESLSVVAVANIPSRLSPPEKLNADEADLWRAVVASKPVEWFQPDTAPLLVDYCRASVMSDRLDTQIKAVMTGEQDGDLNTLMRLRDMEARRTAGLATKMRLTNQSRYTPQAAATAAKKGNPATVWQFGKSQK